MSRWIDCFGGKPAAGRISPPQLRFLDISGGIPRHLVEKNLPGPLVGDTDDAGVLHVGVVHEMRLVIS